MVNGKTNSKALETQFALRPPVLLHEGDNHRALVVVVLVIHFRQRDSVLRIMPEWIWKKSKLHD